MQSQANLVWKSWEDSGFHLVFHAASRETHLLDELSASVLRVVVSGDWTVESAAAELVREFDIELEAQADAVRFVTAVIPRFVDLGLIRGFSL